MITAITPSSPIFTSALQELTFQLSGGATRATIRLMCHDTTLIDATFFPDDGGLITLADLDQLLSDELRLARRSVLTIEATDDQGSTWQSGDIDIVYCTADVGVTSASAFIDNYFLSTLLGPKTTAPGRTEFLSATGASAASGTVTASYLTSAGTITTRTTALQPDSESNGIYKYVISPADYVDDSKGSLTSFSVNVGARRQDYIVETDRFEPAPVLLFTNAFSCQEFLYCKGEHQADPTYDRQSTRFNGRRRNYHIDETRSFKADTGILTTAEANWADELLRSDEVYLWVDGAPGREVVITESKSERTSSPQELPRFTFSYEYAQRVHNVVQLEHRGRIFDNTFDATFN